MVSVNCIFWLIVSVSGLALPENQPAKKDEVSGVYKVDFRVSKAVPPPSLAKRYVQEPLDLHVYYLVDLEIGSNKQVVSLIADTGSWITWALGANATNSTDKVYNPDTSTTSRYTGNGSSLGYGTTDVDTSLQVVYYFDQVTFPNGPVASNVSIGLNSHSDVFLGNGILGIGDVQSESPETFLITLTKEGIIKHQAFSLYLDTLDSLSGSILFGGIDHAKYTGPLYTFGNNVQQIQDTDGVPIANPGYVTIDSGTPTFAFTNATRDAIWASIGDPVCDQGDKAFTFHLNDLTIDIPYSEFVFPTGNGTCDYIYIYEAFEEQEGTWSILGQAFLRHAYSVFDYTEEKTYLAPIKYTTDSNITEIS